jgi:hypothetical protein
MIASMNTLFLILLLAQALQMPKNDPNGVWEAPTGTKFQIAINGRDLAVHLVPGSNQTYIEYEMKLSGSDEPNLYEGSGYFVAKKNDKQCRFETNWKIVVVTPDKIIGNADSIIPDFESCTVKEREPIQLDLKKTS